MSKSMVAVITAVITAVVSVCSTLVVVKYTGEDGTEKEVRAEIQYEENGGDSAVFEPYELSGGQQTVSGDTSMYKVDIKSARIACDSDGEKSVVVKFSYTNNTDRARAFFSATDYGVYQNGVSLQKTYGDSDSNDPFGCDYPDDKEVMSGATFEFEMGFLIDDEDADILVEVIGDSGPDFTVSRTFTLS